MNARHDEECQSHDPLDVNIIHDGNVTLAEAEEQLKFRHISHLTVRYSERMFVLSVIEYPQLRVTGRTLGEAFHNLCVADNRRVHELKNRPPQDIDQERRDAVRAFLSYEERYNRILRTYSPESIPEACAALDKEFER